MKFPDYDASGDATPYDVAATHHYLGEIEKGESGGSGGSGGGGGAGCAKACGAIVGITLALFVISQFGSCSLW